MLLLWLDVDGIRFRYGFDVGDVVVMLILDSHFCY
jgi:hypothetical protein